MSNNDLQMLMGGGGNLLLRRRMMMQKKNEPMPKANEIWYEADEQVTLYSSYYVSAHTFADGRGVVTFSMNIPTMNGAWFRSTPITNVYFPKGVTEIKGSYLFAYCTSLALAELPDGITSIGPDTFRGCTSLAITSLPNTITSIGQRAFNQCTSIQSLTIPIEAPPSLGINAFYGTSFPIYVPAESVDIYKAASGWSTYADRIFAIPE